MAATKGPGKGKGAKAGPRGPRKPSRGFTVMKATVGNAEPPPGSRAARFLAHMRARGLKAAMKAGPPEVARMVQVIEWEIGELPCYITLLSGGALTFYQCSAFSKRKADGFREFQMRNPHVHAFIDPDGDAVMSVHVEDGDAMTDDDISEFLLTCLTTVADWLGSVVAP